MKSLGYALLQRDRCPYEKGTSGCGDAQKDHTKTQDEGGHVTGVIQLQAREPKQPLKLGQAGRTFHWSPRRVPGPGTSGFQSSSLQTVRLV